MINCNTTSFTIGDPETHDKYNDYIFNLIYTIRKNY